MLTLLIWLVVVCFVIWAVYAIVNAFSIPDPWRTLIFVVCGLFLLALLLGNARALPLPPLLR